MKSTIREVARVSGYGRSTVSLALRNHPSIKLSTREEIRQIAEKIGWKENPLVTAAMIHRRSKLAVKHTVRLGLITNWDRAQAWKLALEKSAEVPIASYSALMIKGMFDRAQERGFELEEFWLGEEKMTEKRMDHILKQRNIQGLVIAPVPLHRQELALEWDRYSLVTVGYSLQRPAINRVTTHHTHGIHLVLKELQKAGYKRPALVMSDNENQRVDGLWELGYTGFILHYYPRLKMPVFLPSLEDWRQENFLAWYEQYRPDALIATDVLTLWKWIDNKPFLCRKKPGLVDLYAKSMRHDIAGLNNHEYWLGLEAVELLINQLMANQRGIPEYQKTMMIEPRWQSGLSIKMKQA
jgi:LacI family transcriptional regulator